MARVLKPTISDTRSIVCIYCLKKQEVGRSAMSVPCRFCQKSLNLEDVRIAGYAARRSVETCGSVTIEARGELTVNVVRCAALSLAGRLKGNVVCLGPVVIASSAMLRGNVEAASLSVAEGAVLQGRYDIGRAR